MISYLPALDLELIVCSFHPNPVFISLTWSLAHFCNNVWASACGRMSIIYVCLYVHARMLICVCECGWVYVCVRERVHLSFSDLFQGSSLTVSIFSGINSVYHIEISLLFLSLFSLPSYTLSLLTPFSLYLSLSPSSCKIWSCNLYTFLDINYKLNIKEYQLKILTVLSF